MKQPLFSLISIWAYTLETRICSFRTGRLFEPITLHFRSNYTLFSEIYVHAVPETPLGTICGFSTQLYEGPLICVKIEGIGWPQMIAWGVECGREKRLLCDTRLLLRMGNILKDAAALEKNGRACKAELCLHWKCIWDSCEPVTQPNCDQPYNAVRRKE